MEMLRRADRNTDLRARPGLSRSQSACRYVVIWRKPLSHIFSNAKEVYLGDEPRARAPRDLPSMAFQTWS